MATRGRENSVVGRIFADPFKYLRVATAVCALVFVTVLAVAIVFVRAGVTDLRLAFGSLIFQAGRPAPALERHFVLVDPHGWQCTGIALKAGDRVRCFASGQINVDLPGLVRSGLLRVNLEEDAARQQRINRGSRSPSATPDLKLTTSESQRRTLELWRPWCGPEGIVDDVSSPRSFAARIHHRIIPTARLGSLIGALSSVNEAPSRSAAFYIGRDMGGAELLVDAPGTLWLNVNDVIDVKDPEHAERFWEDNIGSFGLTIVITRA